MSLSGTVLALITASLAAAATAFAQENPPTSRLFELTKPHLARRGNSIVLVHGISGSSRRDQFWALVEVNNPDGSRKCEWLKLIEPKQRYRFECPLDEAAAKYESRVRVFSDATLEDREVLYEPILDVTPQLLSAAENVDAEPASVPEGTFEAVETPLPVTFKPTWYRRVDRGFGMRAYEHSGDFTVASDELVFVDGKTTIRVPYPQIVSVRWEPLPNDITNHWLVVRFTSGDGKPDGVAFRDGGRLGLRGNTGPIYQAVRRATKK